MKTALKNWDRKNVNDLLGLIRTIEAQGQEIDYSALPTGQLPEHLRELEKHTNYPIWAWDNSGRVITGEGALEVEQGEKILAQIKGEY